jgi:hypothetical protein
MQRLDLGLLGLTKQAIRKVRPDPDMTAQSNQVARMLCAWHVAAMPKNAIGSFRRAGLVLRWNGEQVRLMERIELEAADRAWDVFLHEIVEEEMEDEVPSDDDRDELMGELE